MRCLRSDTRTKKPRQPCAALRLERRSPKAFARRSSRWRSERNGSCNLGDNKRQMETSMIRKGWIAAIFGAAAMLSCGGALAQKQSDTGWYVSGSIGKNDDLDDEHAWKISGGYQLNRNVAFEFGYAGLGEANPGFGVHAEASAWELIGVFSYPLQNQFSIYGLLGLARIETKVT